MRKTRKPRTGQIVAVVFLDHCQDHPKPLEVTVYGKVIDVQDGFIVVECWEHSEAHDNQEANSTRFTIIRSCIRSIRILS